MLILGWNVFNQRRWPLQSGDGYLESDVNQWSAHRLVLQFRSLVGHRDARLGGQDRQRPHCQHRRRYNPKTDTWTAITTKRRTVRPWAIITRRLDRNGDDHLGRLHGSANVNDGARYNPVTDTWTSTSLAALPQPVTSTRPCGLAPRWLFWEGSPERPTRLLGAGIIR